MSVVFRQGARRQSAAAGAKFSGQLFDQQLADQLTSRLTVIGRDVKMGNGSDHERAECGNLDATLCRRSSDGRSRNRSGVDHDDIRLDGLRIDGSRHMAGDSLSE